MLSLRKDLHVMENIGSIEGLIVDPHKKQGQFWIELYQDSMSPENLLDVRSSEDGQFHFYAKAGAYYIMAYQDSNFDYKLEKDDRVGFNVQAIRVGIGENIDRIRIELSENIGKTELVTKHNKFTSLWPGITNIGQVTTLSDPRFSTENARRGLWEPLSFSMEVGPGVFFLEEFDPEKTPVLFVHGIGGSPKEWAPIINSMDRSRFQPWLLYYETGFPLDMSSQYLFHAMKYLHRVYPFDTAYLVAHSMGGLISASFIQQYQEAGSDYLKLFVSLATPWSGHEGADLGVRYAPVVIPVWRDMAPGSQFLLKVQDMKLPENLPHYLLFAYQGNSMMTPGNDDGAVSIKSQLQLNRQYRAHKVYGIDTDHSGILQNLEVMNMVKQILNDEDSGVK